MNPPRGSAGHGTILVMIPIEVTPPLYLENPPPCFDCELYSGELKCKAFPAGIPDEILDGKNDHRKPYPGDHGIVFSARDEDE